MCISGLFFVLKRSIAYGENNENDNSENINVEPGTWGAVHGAGDHYAVYHGTDSGSGQHAASDAPAGADLWICLRLEIWTGGRICSAAASKRDVWNAAADADRILYGI